MNNIVAEHQWNAQATLLYCQFLCCQQIFCHIAAIHGAKFAIDYELFAAVVIVRCVARYKRRHRQKIQLSYLVCECHLCHQVIDKRIHLSISRGRGSITGQSQYSTC